jgi:hypothetical protein
MEMYARDSPRASGNFVRGLVSELVEELDCQRFDCFVEAVVYAESSAWLYSGYSEQWFDFFKGSWV